MKEPQRKKPTHAYIIPYFTDKTGIKILSGRERAIHTLAVKRLKLENPQAICELINKQEKLLDENGSNPSLKLHRNLSGVLLCGRTALPGGKRESAETSEQAAIRELGEEFGLHGIKITDLVLLEIYRLDGKRCEAYYTLDLDTLKLKPEAIIQAFNRKPTEEKRLLEIATPQELITRLAAPDDSDKDYILGEMKKFSNSFCKKIGQRTKQKISADAQNKLAQDLFEYQIQRTFHSVVAAREFQKRFASTTSLKDQAQQILLAPPSPTAERQAVANSHTSESTLRK